MEEELIWVAVVAVEATEAVVMEAGEDPEDLEDPEEAEAMEEDTLAKMIHMVVVATAVDMVVQGMAVVLDMAALEAMAAALDMEEPSVASKVDMEGVFPWV